MNPTISIQAEKMYSSEEISDYLSLSLRTVQRLLQSGSLKSYKLHGQYRIKGLDLLSYLDGVRQDPEAPVTESGKPAELLEQLRVSPVTLEGAVDLLPLINTETNPGFGEALHALRREISLELGFILPGVRLCDNLDLAPGQYRIQIFHQVVAEGRVNGAKDDQHQLLSHFGSVIRSFAHEILMRDEVYVMIERLRRDYPVLVEEALSLDGPQAGKLTIGQLTRVLRLLLAEQVSIRNLPRILEILADHPEGMQQPEQLSELVRQGLSRQLCAAAADAESLIRVVCLSPASEDALREAFATHGPRQLELLQQLEAGLARVQNARTLLCAADLRPQLRQLLWRRYSHWQMLAYQEIDRLYRLEPVSTLELA